MCAPDAPAPPDPAKTAGAQTANNVSTAIAQSQLNNVNQVGPNGSLTYDQTGSYEMTDPNTGSIYQLPQYTATQTLSESGQQIQDLNDQTAINTGTLARDQSGRLNDLLSNPVEMGNDAIESRLMELGSKRLDPQLDRRRDQMETQLANQGITLGSTAYDRAMEGVGQSENDAYNQLLLSGRAQANQEVLTERNQPINEITALMSGSQVSQPNFVNTNPAQIANVDRAGLEMGAHQQEMNIWNQENANRGGLMGGLFGLASAGITGGMFG